MANVNGIEVSGTTYDVEDTSARNTASSASSVATQASNDVSALQTTVNNISDSVDRIGDDLQDVKDNIGDLANLDTTTKTDLVSAINEVAGAVQSRPTVTITTTKSSASSTSELTPADLVAAGYTGLEGSYIVTVYRSTSDSMSYFIGWIKVDHVEIWDASFTKLAGKGNSLAFNGTELVYSGGDSATETTWIFEPIGDSHLDN